jgi:hypothetical protein
MMCNVSWSGVSNLRSDTSNNHGFVSFGPFEIRVSSTLLTVFYNSNVIYSGTITNTSVNISNDAVTANTVCSLIVSHKENNFCGFGGTIEGWEDFPNGYRTIIDFYVTVNVSAANCSGNSYSSSLVKECNFGEPSFTLLNGYAFTSVQFIISECSPFYVPCL